MANTIRDMIKSPEFICGIELVSTFGILQVEGKELMEFANQVMASKQFDFISITDNAGGNPMLAPETIGHPLLEKGYSVNIHLTCKDRNRNALEMKAWQYASDGFNNILALSGDYPIAGYSGIARPVFDVDSVVLIKMLNDMNEGLIVPVRKGKEMTLSRTDFCVSATVSPFKKHEGEYLTQLFKMEKKINAGAEYFIIQVGYDSRKWAELLTYVKMKNLNVPMLANIYVLTKGVARLFNQNIIPGCNVSDKFLKIINKQAESPDRGRAFFLELAAKQYAIAKGLGFKGAYLGGAHKSETAGKILDIVKSFSPDDWKGFYKEIQYPLEKEFYLFALDENTGYPKQEYSRKYANSIRPVSRFIRRVFTTPPILVLSKIVHLLVFNTKSPFYYMIRLFYRIVDKSKLLTKLFHFPENIGKRMLYGCRDCGDCSLFDVAYLCPESKCSKNQRNGPCGGSKKGKCEVDDKKCIWFKAYKRLKSFGQERDNLDGPIIITDANLLETSGWQNYFLGRDHTSKLLK